MVSFSIQPQEAANDGCSVSVSEESWDLSTSEQIWYGTKRQATAYAAEGWEFDYFELSQSTPDGTRSGKPDSNPYPRDKGESSLLASETFKPTPGSELVWEPISAVAVFKRAVVTITIETVNNPNNGGFSNSTPARADGQLGDDDVTFLLRAVPFNGYGFVKWTNSEGDVIAKTPDTQVTHSFGKVDETYTYTAHFRESSGKILYNPSTGKILYGKSGSILYDG